MIDSFVISEEIDSALARVQWDRKLAVATSRKHAFNLPNVSQDGIYCFQKTHNIQTKPLSMFLRKSYHLLPQLNHILRQLMESGHFEKWERDSRLRSANSVDQGRMVRLDHFMVMNKILIGLLSGASLVFLLELFTYRMIRRRKRSKFWRLIHLILEPQRLFLL